MLEHKLLPVRLRPIPNEHVSAYLLRLAIANGRSSVRELLATIGIKGIKAKKHQAPDTLAALARYLGQDPKDLRASLLRTGILGQIPAHDNSRIYRNLELPYPRICVTCIQNGPFIPAYAGQLPFTHCLEHGHELIHACPKCHSLFGWSEELFECICKACGEKIEQIDSTSTLPSYADELITRQSDSISLNCYIGDLLLALKRALEPISSDLTAREWPPAEPLHWPSILRRAYSLLENIESISAWIAACKQRRSAEAQIGKAAVHLPIDSLRENLVLRWRLHEQDGHLTDTMEVIDTYYPDSPAPLAPVDHITLSKVFGCKPSEILSLLETGAIESIKGHKSVRDARFELAVLARQVEQLNPGNAGEFISIEQSARIASAHGGHTGHVLAGILLKAIPFRLKHGRETFLEGALVGREGLLFYMAKHFASLESTPCTLQGTIAITGLTEPEITQACTLGLIKPLGWKSSFYFVGRDIDRLLSTYISVRRWSKISEVKLSKLRNGLDSQDFSACIDGALYKRTPALESWLDSFTSR